MKDFYLLVLITLTPLVTSHTLYDGFNLSDLKTICLGTHLHQEIVHNSDHIISRIHKRLIYIPNEERQNREEQLDLVLWRLKSFVIGSKFESQEFQIWESFLGRELKEISEWATNISLSSELWQQITFAQKLYDVMVDANESLRLFLYDDSGSPVVCSVIVLYVGLWDLYNTQGNPDFQAEGFSDTVSRLTRVLKFMGEVFKALENVPLYAHVIFDLYFERAETTLEDLKKAIFERGDLTH